MRRRRPADVSVQAATEPYVLLEALGVVAFAVSGAMMAVQARMDWLGVALGASPVAWVDRPWPVLAAALTAAGVIAVTSWHPQSRPDSWRVLQVADAAGLAVFTTTGTLVALAYGVAGPVAALLGVVTGTGGGVLRDVLARQRPLLLMGEIYALASAAGATLLVVLVGLGASGELSGWAAIALTLALRLLAIRYHWSLPRFAGS